MIAKTQLDTAHPLHGNLLLACGFDEASGNIINLIDGQLLGVLNSSATRGSDPTYGATLDGDGTVDACGATFGNTLLNGLMQGTVFLWQKSNVGVVDTNHTLLGKFGGSDDTYGLTWESSENVSAYVGIGSTHYGDSIVNGLESGIGVVDPLNWHAVGSIFDVSAGNEYHTLKLNKLSGAGTVPATGPINTTAHDLVTHTSFNGSLAVLLIFDKALTETEWNALVDNPAGVFLQPTALSNPGVANTASTGTTAQVTSNRAAGTLYFYVSTSATPPTVADLKSGTGAVSFGNQPAVLGVNSLAVSGLTPLQNYYVHFVQHDGSVDTDIVSTAQFTTTDGTPVIVGPLSLTEGQQATIPVIDYNGGGTVRLSNGSVSIVQNEVSFDGSNLVIDVAAGLQALIDGAQAPVAGLPFGTLTLEVEDTEGVGTLSVDYLLPANYIALSIMVADADTSSASLLSGLTVEDGAQLVGPTVIGDDTLTYETANGNATGRIQTDGDGTAVFSVYLWSSSTGELEQRDITLQGGAITDTTPPAFALGPSATDVTESGFSIQVASTEAGTGALLITAANATQPTDAAFDAVALPLTANQLTTFVSGAVEADTTHWAWIQLVDESGNRATQFVSVLTQSAPDTTEPIVVPPANITLQVSAGSAGLAHTDPALVAWMAEASATDETGPASPDVTNNLASLPDPLSPGNHTLTFSAIDAAGNTGQATATLTVVETAGSVNAAPLSLDQVLSVAESSVVGAVVGTVIATDAEGDPLSYSIIAGNTNGAFAIEAGTGQLTVAKALDYAVTARYILKVEITDSHNGSVVTDITIHVTPQVVLPPVDALMADFVINPGSAVQEKRVLYPGNTHLVEVRNLQYLTSQIAVNDATVNVTLKANGNNIVGQSWPVALTLAQEGHYWGTLNHLLDLANLVSVDAEFSVSTQNGSFGAWTIPLRVKQRTR